MFSRALLLSALLAAPAAAADWPPPRALGARMCDSIADPVRRSALFDSHAAFRDNWSGPETVTLDINHDGATEAVTFRRSGTASVPLLSAEKIIVGWSELPPGLDAEMVRRHFGGAVNVLTVDGWSFLLASSDPDHRYPEMLYIVGPDDLARPVCRFAADDRFVLGDAARAMAPRCHAMLAASQLSPLPVAPPHEDILPAVSPGQWGGVVTGHVTADVLNSGRPLRLVEMRFDSGAGRGCELTWFDLADAPSRDQDLTARLRAVLLDLQEVYPDPRGFAPNCSGSAGTRQLVIFDGLTWVMVAPSRTPDIRIRRLYPGADGAGDGGTETACAFIRDPIITVSWTSFDWLAH